ncbi:NAD(P)/FAD-dependent oxidoreductase [Alkalihalobacillus pseudalcaliphilus]|uniref:NAD(P)/FAD-dependent oxidoreductase n=1 Tax=Alkalihalobacillus pseudalcaliphilus TaxID=79884 RepID=UPI00064DA4D9|nr:NAD(P)/FAD-dependent oxidoreductase [Alkalihalobacillus pseudalcaliphilus]KMK74936.1 thioredoxin reductase [Alkalihalobacillus pseudalcaliphilus]
MNSQDLFDVTIIGGGPAGLYSAFYSGLREMKTKIIEFQPHLGGKVHIYPEKMIWDVGGLTPTPGANLIEQLVQQGLTFNPEVVLNEKITTIARLQDGIFELTAHTGEKHFSKAIIIAVGGGILSPQKIEIEGAERYEMTNLHYTVKSLKQFKDKKVLISGGGNSAIDWANELEPIASHVYITYRKEELKGHEAQVSQLLNSGCTCYLQTSITKLLPNEEHDSIQTVELTNLATNEKVYVEVDEVVINHGYERDSELLKESPLDIVLKDDFYIDGTAQSESNIPGLFAAGDILAHPGKVHLIAGAFQDAANAVNKAKQYIEPDAHGYGMVSSHNELFKTRNKELKKVLYQTR